MKWLIYCPKDKKIWDYYMRKENNLIIQYAKSFQDLDRFHFDRVICCQENNYLAQEAKEKGILTFFVGSEEPKNKEYYQAIYLFDNIKNIIDSAYQDKFIPAHFSATSIDNIMPWLFNRLKKKANIAGIFRIADKEDYSATKIMKFYNIKADIGPDNIKDITIRLDNYQTMNFFDQTKINIYIPTYYRLEKTKRSLLTIIEASQKSKYDIKIYVGDNNTKINSMKEWLQNLAGIELYLHSENIGKANMINLLHKKSRNCDYIFNIDSDMVIEDQNHQPLEKMIQCLERCDNVGLVSSNQKECNQHWFNRGVEKISERGYNLGYSPDGIGIAGGCIVMRTKDWDKIGGYKENHDIYTGDDGILTYKVGRFLGKRVLISIDSYLLHPNPSEDEKGYTEWKAKSWQRDQLNFIKDNYQGSNKKGYYD
jgi:hypothetical protein